VLTPVRFPPIRRLLFAYGVNQLGDWAGDLALAVGVFAATRSAAAVAATLLVHRALFGPVTPLLVARLEHLDVARVLAGLYLAQAVIFTALAATVGRSGLVAVLPLAAAAGVLAPTARALARSALVSVAKPRGVHRDTNAVVNVIFTTNAMLAPALGGVLVAIGGPAPALLADVATFLVAARAVAGVDGLAAPEPATSPATSALVRLREGVGYVAERRVLWRLLAAGALLMLFIFATEPIEVAYITGTLGAGSEALGIMLSAWGVGMIAGGALAARFRSAALPRQMFLSGAALAVACLGIGLSPSLAPVICWAVVGGIGNGVFGMTFLTALQEQTADSFQARVSSLYEATASTAPGLAFVLGGVLAEAFSPRAVYLVAGAGGLAVVACAVATAALGKVAEPPART
jgi:hypothetical protein